MNDNNPTILPLGQEQWASEKTTPYVFVFENPGEPSLVDSLIATDQQSAASEAVSKTTERSLELAAAIRLHGLSTYDVAVSQMLAFRNQERAPEHQALIEAYAAQELQLLRRDLSAIEMLGVVNVARHIESSLHPSQKR